MGKGRRPGWGACAGASPQPLDSPWCCVLAPFSAPGRSSCPQHQLPASPVLCQGGDLAPRPHPALRAPRLAPPQAQPPQSPCPAPSQGGACGWGSNPSPEHRSSRSRTWVLACQVPHGVEASGSDHPKVTDPQAFGQCLGGALHWAQPQLRVTWRSWGVGSDRWGKKQGLHSKIPS